ncbi:ribose 5-phosphate isomerase B [bacterium]|nr:ribose 5-phosphate isomerase B [bacterium]
MKIAIGSDHGGFALKRGLIDALDDERYEIIDEGVFDEKSSDYPDTAQIVASRIVEGDADFGILICTTGIGMSIAANKVAGARAALACDVARAEMARRHNDANILCLGAAYTTVETAGEAARIFLSTEFEGDKAGGERHKRRVQKIMSIERKRS